MKTLFISSITITASTGGIKKVRNSIRDENIITAITLLSHIYRYVDNSTPTAPGCSAYIKNTKRRIITCSVTDIRLTVRNCDAAHSSGRQGFVIIILTFLSLIGL